MKGLAGGYWQKAFFMPPEALLGQAGMSLWATRPREGGSN
jgi:hypothetical protein